jgi:hypothetical protein
VELRGELGGDGFGEEEYYADCGEAGEGGLRVGG